MRRKSLQALASFVMRMSQRAIFRSAITVLRRTTASNDFGGTVQDDGGAGGSPRLAEHLSRARTNR
jgi:hypothetical protein